MAIGEGISSQLQSVSRVWRRAVEDRIARLPFRPTVDSVFVRSTSPSPNTFERTVYHLREAAWAETVRTTLTALSQQDTPLGKAAQALREGRVWEQPMPFSVEGLAKELGAQTEARFGPDVADALKDALGWQLYTFRGGRRVEVSYRLEGMEIPPTLVRSSVQGQSGFRPDIAAMDLSAPHSMGDLGQYASAYFGRTFIDDLIGNHRSVEIHNGSAEDAIASLRYRGFEATHRLATPRIHYQILLAHHPTTGEIRYAIACDDGPDMAGHLEKMIRAASVERGETVSRVESSQVTRFDHRSNEASYRYQRLRQAFESSGPIPGKVAVGFKNAILNDLRRRSDAVQTLRHLQSVESGVLDEARQEEIDALGLGDLYWLLAQKPHELLASSASQARMKRLDESAKSAFQSAPLEIRRLGLARLVSDEGLTKAAPVPLATVDGPDAFLDHSRLAYRDRDGAIQELLLIRNPYGEASKAAGRLFADRGVEDIFVLGTAAALDKDAEIGKMYLPARVASPEGQVTDFVNHGIAEADLLPPSAQVGGRVANVRSPADEFDRDVNRLREEGNDLIEMELSGQAAGLHGSDTRLSAVYLVSDVPQSGHALHSFSADALSETIPVAVDILVRRLGMAELVHLGPSRTPIAS